MSKPDNRLGGAKIGNTAVSADKRAAGEEPKVCGRCGAPLGSEAIYKHPTYKVLDERCYKEVEAGERPGRQGM